MKNTENRPSRVVLNIEYYGPNQVTVPVDDSATHTVSAMSPPQWLEEMVEVEIQEYWHDLQGSAEEQRLSNNGDWVSREDWDTGYDGDWEEISTELVRSFPNVDLQAMGLGA